jgi:hypothetical protein
MLSLREVIEAGVIDDGPKLRTKKSGDEQESQECLSGHGDPEVRFDHSHKK